jgi:hypothetical protein
MLRTRCLVMVLSAFTLVACGGDGGDAEDGCDQGEAVSNECLDQGEGMTD